jgi:hypothetical protein
MAVPAQAALVGFWALDEASGTSFADSAGTANTASCSTACPTVTTGVIGAHAWTWDGSDDLMTVAAETEINDLAALSLSWWMSPTSAGEGGAGTIANKRGTGLNGWLIGFDDVAGRTRCLRMAVDWSGGVLTVRTGNDTLPTHGSGWYHVVVTWDGSATATTVHVYVNGTEVSSYQTQTNGSGIRETDVAEALLFGNGPTQAATFAGSLDELRLFSHVLSGAEIASEYARGPVAGRRRLWGGD